MIKKIELKNFQSHKNTIVEFSEGLNCFIGTGDNGKSAVLKALLWVLTNKPDGDSFISHWAKKSTCSVTVYTDAGYVKRVKGKEGNYYELNEQVYKAFGKNVPDDVVEFLNLSNINVHTQFEPHFLLSASSSDVSRVLNELTNLDSIDTSLGEANRFIRECKAREKTLNSTIADTTKELELYEDLDKVERTLKRVELLEEKYSSISTSANTLMGHLESVEHAKKALTQFEDTDTNNLMNILTEIESCLATLNALEASIKALKDLKDRIFSTRTSMVKLKNIDIVNKQIEGIEETAIAVDTLLQQIQSLESIITFCDECQKEMTKLATEYQADENLFHEMMGDTCPLCERSLV